MKLLKTARQSAFFVVILVNRRKKHRAAANIPTERSGSHTSDPLKNQIEAQRSGFDLERKKETTDMELSRTAEAEWS